MKDLRGAKRILGIEILRDRNKRTLFRNQKWYFDKVLIKFSMQAVVPTSVHLASHYILSYKQCPSTNLEKKKNYVCSIF